jgi:hypothetical protein
MKSYAAAHIHHTSHMNGEGNSFSPTGMGSLSSGLLLSSPIRTQVCAAQGAQAAGMAKDRAE